MLDPNLCQAQPPDCPPGPPGCPEPSGVRVGLGALALTAPDTRGDHDEEPSSGGPDSAGATEASLVCTIGQRVGQDFVILELIARGGMAEIYRARHESMRREVALKVLSRRYQCQPEVRLRFETEARAHAETKHPNIVEIYHASRDPQVGFYIVMELLHGKTLRQVMDRVGQLSIREALMLAIVIGDAMQSVHDLEIIHRDIKPENIFLEDQPGKRWIPKMLDLGIAKIEKYNQRTTQNKHAFGTVTYMSPEQVNGDKITPASDIYSLGVVLYEMLGGRLPYGQNHPSPPTRADYARWHMDATPTPLSELIPRFPEHLWRVILRALEKIVKERWATMVDFVTALSEALREESNPRRADDDADRAETKAPQEPAVITASKWQAQTETAPSTHGSLTATPTLPFSVATAPVPIVTGRAAPSPPGLPVVPVRPGTEPMARPAERVAAPSSHTSFRTERMLGRPAPPVAFLRADPTAHAEIRSWPPLDEATRARAKRCAELTGLRDPSACEELENALQDAHPIVRRTAARSLESAGNTMSLGALRRAMAVEPSMHVRACFEQTIGVLDATRRGAPPTREPAPTGEAREPSRSSSTPHMLGARPAERIAAGGVARAWLQVLPLWIWVSPALGLLLISSALLYRAYGRAWFAANAPPSVAAVSSSAAVPSPSALATVSVVQPAASIAAVPSTSATASASAGSGGSVSRPRPASSPARRAAPPPTKGPSAIFPSAEPVSKSDQLISRENRGGTAPSKTPPPRTRLLD